MEAVAVTKYVRMSPFKIRRMAKLIRGKNVDEAINILHFTLKAATTPLEKTVRSAVANLSNVQEDAAKIESEDIFIKEVRIDEGPTTRRFRSASMGRVMRMRRRTSHIKIVVTTKES